MTVIDATALSPSQKYSRFAVILHWIIAFLFLGSYTTVYYHEWFTEKETPEHWVSIQLHFAIGITIAAFVLMRVIWRFMNPPPEHLPAPAWQIRTASTVHFLLYAFMILMPITGYLGTGAPTEYLGIPKFEDTFLFQALVADQWGLTFKEFEKPIDFFHKRSGEYVVWILIAIHIAGALYHHHVMRDATMRRMMP